MRNNSLRVLLTHSRWSLESLARAVNAVGAETGLVLRYDRTAVSHWLSGTRPRGPVPALIAETFSRKLGRPITLADIGLASPYPACAVTTAAGEHPADIVAALAGAATDACRDTVGGPPIYRLAALVVPNWPPAVRLAPTAPRRGHPGPRVEALQVDAACRIAEAFAAADHGFGGGYARAALAAYLAVDITGCLRAEAVDTVHRALLGVATDLVLLAGFKGFDCQDHGLAQRCYLTALALAVRAGDAIRYAVALRALSQQAHHLGHHRHALALARTALRTTAGLGPPHIEAFLHAEAAVCHAALDHHDTALAHHHAARHHLAAASSLLPVFGSYNAGELAYHQAGLRTSAGDTAGAITALRTALRHYPHHHRRSRTLALAALAERQLDIGLFNDACATGYRFFENYPHLHSGRVTTALNSLLQRLRPLRHHPTVNHFLTHVKDRRYHPYPQLRDRGSLPEVIPIS